MSNQKRDIGLNLLAIAIFAMTLSSLLSPILNISPFIPAGATFIVLGLLTVDNFTLDSRGIELILDSFASAEERKRVIHHEAGHFLTAYFLGIPIQEYTLTAWEALQAGHYGQGGVIIDATEVTDKPFDLAQTRLTLDRFCTVWMAGVAAEKIAYDDALGGAEDYQQLKTALNLAGLSPQAYDQKARWGQLQATNLIKRYESSYEALVTAMEERKSIAECYSVIQENCQEAQE